MRKFGFTKIEMPIYVPESDYRSLCPFNMEQYVSMIGCEENVITKFSPKPDDTVIDIYVHLELYTLISVKGTVIRGRLFLQRLIQIYTNKR